MRSNTINSETGRKIRRLNKQTSQMLQRAINLLTLGLSGRQWLASLLIKAAKQIPKSKKAGVPSRQISAVVLLLALLVPIAAPIPVWAYNLNLPPMSAYDDGLRLTAPAFSLAESSMNVFGSLFNSLATFISPSVKSVKESQKDVSKESLEREVKGIETQIADEQEVATGQVLSLAAIPVDKNSSPVNGLAAEWESSNAEVVKIINDSQAVALKKGEAKLTVSSGKFAREIVVSVSDRVPSAANSSIENTRESNLITPEEPALTEGQAENMLTPENNLGNPPGQTEMGSSSRASATRTRERHGSSNYSFGIPVASLPGRGIDAGIGITYNSRVWNKSDSGGVRVFDFNINRNWLAPGFEMGFGEIEGYSTGSGCGYLLSDPDGTRHQLIQRQVAGNCTTYESSDGTFIQTTVCGIFAAPIMLVKYPDGSQVTYGDLTPQNKRFPISIVDRNGNTISITYIQGDTVGKIANIRDTLNRYITFHYDTTPEMKLVAVSVPGFNDSPTPRQTIRFYYEDLTLQVQGRFEQPVQVNAPTTPIKVLKYVYFPGTQTGYRYDYSPYFGMIYKIWGMRGMQASTASLTGTGTIMEGSATAWTHYNYAATAMETGGIPLTDVPKYSWRKDDWLGRTTNIPQTSFSTIKETMPNPQGVEVGTQTTTVTAPNGAKSISVSKITPTGEWDNGLLTEMRLETIEGEQARIWSKTKLYWQQGDNQPTGRDNPRLEKIESTDDAGQIKATGFEYDGYNNQKTVREHDFAAENVLGTELRRTETTYETGAGWINNRLLRLPKETKTIVNNTIAVSKIVYEYDNYSVTSLADAPGVTQHDRKYNPYNPPDPGTYQCNCRFTCDTSEPFGHSSIPFCPNGDPPIRVCDQCPNPIVPAIIYRGNVTKVTAFADATLADDPNASVSIMKYDITGNQIEASLLNCCDLKTWEYSPANKYAYPTKVTRGTGVQLITEATFDFNTGLMVTGKDENIQDTDYQYEPDTLRPKKVIYPNGGDVLTEYSDKLTSDPNQLQFVKTTTKLDATKTAVSYSYFNGRGAGVRTAVQTPDNWSVTAVEYDSLGRPQKSYNPFYAGEPSGAIPPGTKFTEVVNYDALNRTTSVKLQDLTTVSTAFGDATTTPANFKRTFVTVTDQAGKQRRQVADALGRIVRVDEPDMLSNSLGGVATPTQPTVYEYDGNDNLVKVIQTEGAVTQERRFKYDSLSRLTHEKQVEAIATLDDAGLKQTSGGLWTKVLKYSPRGLLTDGTDARGVKTSFIYDGLHRVKQVSFTNETDYQTPTINYTYDQERTNFFNNGALTTVTTAGNGNTLATATEFDYDKMGHVTKHRQTIGTQVYPLEYSYNLAGQLTSQTYPSGKVVTTGYDANGRLATVADASRTYLSGVSYAGNGNNVNGMALGNGTAQGFAYNDRLQLTSQTLVKPGVILQQYDYGYGQIDAMGNLDLTKNNGQLAKVESYIGAAKQWTQKFRYDSLGRLADTEEYKGATTTLSYKQKFDYDRFGNLYRKAASNPAAGQQTPLPFTPIEEGDISKTTNQFTTNTSYDDAGNVIADTKFRQMSFGYDANGRVVKAVRANTPDAVSVYDASGQRVAEKVGDVWKFSIYDAFGKMIAEYGGLPSPGQGGVKYVFTDWQGSTRAITDNAGLVKVRMDYTAFGEEIGASVGQRTTAQGFNAANNINQKYALTERDQASGLDHTWFRKLENRAGRWTSPDPYNGSMKLGNPQSFNRYSYVGNEPTNFVDPTRLCGFRIELYNCYQDENGKIKCKSRFILDSASCNGASTGGTFGGGGGGGRSRYSPYLDSGGGDGRRGRRGGIGGIQDVRSVIREGIEQGKRSDKYDERVDKAKIAILNSPDVQEKLVDFRDKGLRDHGIAAGLGEAAQQANDKLNPESNGRGRAIIHLLAQIPAFITDVDRGEDIARLIESKMKPERERCRKETHQN